MQPEKHSLSFREQGLFVANISRPLDIRVGPEAVSQEALLDHYVQGFQALQSIAQAIPQPKHSKDALTPLSKDRVDDFARSFSSKETLRSPSAFRPVPSKGACMLFEKDPRVESKGLVNGGHGGHRQQSAPMPSLMELDEALELSLNPVPKFGILMARVDAASRDATSMGSEARDGNGAGLDYGRPLRDQLQLQASQFGPPKVFEGDVGRGRDVPYGAQGQSLDPLWGIEGVAHLREDSGGARESPKGQSFLESPTSVQGGFVGGSAPVTRAGERLENTGKASSRWCGTLFTDAWLGGGAKRKREEPKIEEEELVKLLEWMERSTSGLSGRRGGTAVPTLDGVLERLEEILGFRRRGGGVDLMQGAVERPKTSSGAIKQVVLDINELTGMKDSIRTVPLGRGWEEDCIRQVLEQIIWQGATRGKKARVKGSSQDNVGSARA